MYQTTTTSKPTAHITRAKSRLKVYGNTQVFLKDGSNFEIELFNPRTESVLAKIWINGKLISSAGLIIRPGQRAHIERFIDEPKKFVFNTYEVENTSEALAATANNGLVKVEFYEEIVQSYSINEVITPFTMKRSIPSFPPPAPYYDGGFNYSMNSPFVGTCSTYFSNSMQSDLSSKSLRSSATMDWMETGRIEKGEDSKQKFESASGNFSYTPFETVSWKIMPESAKPVEINEIRSYCTNCGTRQKKSTWKYCPSCGTPINE